MKCTIYQTQNTALILRKVHENECMYINERYS